MLCYSCSDNNTAKNNLIVEKMQKNIDSCADLYLKAINEVREGQSRDIVKAKYSNAIVSLHANFTSTFDSLTSEYLNKKLSQTEYDRIVHSIILDSVDKRSQELSRLGIEIEFK